MLAGCPSVDPAHRGSLTASVHIIRQRPGRKAEGVVGVAKATLRRVFVFCPPNRKAHGNYRSGKVAHQHGRAYPAVLMTAKPPDRSSRMLEILRQAKTLAREYYALTGRPLGITGEVAELEAARLLGVELADVRQSGFDAIRRSGEGVVRLQIKGRCYGPDAKPGQRLGSIQLAKEWDAVLLVLLDLDYEAREIWEADRRSITEALTKPGSIARNQRGALGVQQFKRIGRQVWKSDAISANDQASGDVGDI